MSVRGSILRQRAGDGPAPDARPRRRRAVVEIGVIILAVAVLLGLLGIIRVEEVERHLVEGF